MKKIFTVLALLFVGSIGFTTTYHHYGYFVKCAKCVEETKKRPGRNVNIAWRTTKPYKKEGNKVYAQYHCFGGHYYWAEIN